MFYTLSTSISYYSNHASNNKTAGLLLLTYLPSYVLYSRAKFTGKAQVAKAKKAFRFCKNIMGPSIDPL